MSRSAPVLDREAVDGTCPRCGQSRLATYDVVGEAGWETVVKCQNCLCSVQRTPANRLGPITLLVDLV